MGAAAAATATSLLRQCTNFAPRTVVTGERSHIECRAQEKKKVRTERSKLVAIESAWHNCEQDVKGKVCHLPECLAWSNPFEKNLGTVIGGSVTSKSHWHEGTSCFFAGGVEGQHLRLLSIHKAEALLRNDRTPSAKQVPTGEEGLLRPRTSARAQVGGGTRGRSTFHLTRYKKSGTQFRRHCSWKKASAMYTLSHTSTYAQTRSRWNEAASHVALHTSA